MTTGTEWRDIESAPKDGTPILVFVPDEEFRSVTGQDVIWWEEEEGRWLYGDSSPFKPTWPATHWMPLPAASGTTPAVAVEGVSVETAAGYADFVSEGHRQRANEAEAKIAAALNTMIESEEGWQAYALRLRMVLSATPTKPLAVEADEVERLRGTLQRIADSDPAVDGRQACGIMRFIARAALSAQRKGGAA